METLYFLFGGDFSPSGSPSPPPPASGPYYSGSQSAYVPMGLQFAAAYPYVSATSLVPLLTALQAQIATCTGLPPEKISLSAKDIQPRFKGDQDLYIRLMDATPRPGFEHGSGRTCIILSRPLVLTLRTRYQVDPSDVQNAWFLDPNYGHIIKEEQLFNCLVDQPILDPATSNWLTSEVLHPLPTPPEVMQEKPRGKGWGESHMTFELVYQPSLTPNY